jgi:hypothetical protein
VEVSQLGTQQEKLSHQLHVDFVSYGHKSLYRHGFIEAGMIDGDNLHFPVFDKIIATCRRNP